MSLLRRIEDLVVQVRRQEVDATEVKLLPLALELGKISDHDEVMDGVVGVATLCHWKCRALLPEPEPILDEEEEKDEAPWVWEEREKLYERIQELAGFFRQRYGQMKGYFTRSGKLMLENELIEPGEVLEPVSADQLMQHMMAFLEKHKPTPPYVPPPRVSVEERMEQIVLQLGRTNEGIAFSLLIEDQLTRPAIIATFLAILELIRTGSIRAMQSEPFGEIFLYPAQTSLPNTQEDFTDEAFE